MPEQMQCMEVWGGNVAVERHFHVPGLDIWLHARPHQNEASGGDVYYVSSCASGRITRLLLADASGHGAAVAESALTLRELMRRHVNNISQARFVENLNQEFSRISQEGRYATAVVGTYFSLSGRFQLCRAGHPPPLLYRHRTGAWEISETKEPPSPHSSLCNTPIGVIELAKYVNAECRFDCGDMLLAYTDGLIESRNQDDQLLGTSRLFDLVRAIDPDRPENLLATLMSRLRNLDYSSGADDLTVLLVRADGTNPSWKNNLLAPLRLLRRASDSSRIAVPQPQHNPGSAD